MSDSSAPSSAGSYTSPDVKDQCEWQQTVQKKFKAEQLRALLRSKKIEPKGLKPDLAEAVAGNFTTEEVKEWLTQQQPALAAPAPLANRPSQPTLHDYFARPR